MLVFKPASDENVSRTIGV